MHNIVLGLNFGDEGKGAVTNFLCKEKDDSTIVVRFNGGHQAGHTVCLNENTRHIFSSFGSGSLKGIPTYWSEHCVMYPIALINEFTDLVTKTNEKITLYIDPKVQVTTVYDVLRNQRDAKVNGHGSVGVGIRHTYERSESIYKLYVSDLLYEPVLRHKLKEIKRYYKHQDGTKNFVLTQSEDIYMQKVEQFVALCKSGVIHITNQDSIFKKYKNIIFEGAQGILLDKDHGFFPYVTPSNSTCKNAMSLIENGHESRRVAINYVTRSYFTRHGAGPFPTEQLPGYMLKDGVKDETNIYNTYQEHLRYGALDLQLIDYSLNIDSFYHKMLVERNLFITCIDHIKDTFLVKRTDGTMHSYNLDELYNQMIKQYNFDNIYTSDNPYSQFKKYK